MNPQLITIDARQLEVDIAEQRRKLLAEISRLEGRPWDRWPEGLALPLYLLALTKVFPQVTHSSLDELIILVGFVAPFVAFSFRIYRLSRLSNLLARALRAFG